VSIQDLIPSKNFLQEKNVWTVAMPQKTAGRKHSKQKGNIFLKELETSHRKKEYRKQTRGK
jgi:hypothetical protein